MFEFDRLYRQVFAILKRNLAHIHGAKTAKHGLHCVAKHPEPFCQSSLGVQWRKAQAPIFQNARESVQNWIMPITRCSLWSTYPKDLQKLLKRRYALRGAVVIDNASGHKELEGSDVVKLMRNERVLYILLAHDEKEPDGLQQQWPNKMAGDNEGRRLNGSGDYRAERPAAA